jgi:hypothetical protein
VQKQQRQGKRGRRIKHEPPKVWHNPDVVMGPPRSASQRSSGSEARSEVPAAPTPAPPPSGPAKRRGIVAAASPETDPKVLERDRLVARLATAEGRPAITRAADALLQAGFPLPDDQTIQLQMLEHSREEYVQQAIDKLSAILGAEPCKRQTVLESRLRRLEEFADEPDTRNAARDLRRQVTGRVSANPPEPSQSRRGAPEPRDA